MIRDFIAAVGGERPNSIEVHRALDCTPPGICAIESLEQGGAVIPVPDFRQVKT